MDAAAPPSGPSTNRFVAGLRAAWDRLRAFLRGLLVTLAALLLLLFAALGFAEESGLTLRLLREANGGTWPADLAELLERFRNPKAMGDDETIIRDVQAMRAAVETAARAGLRP